MSIHNSANKGDIAQTVLLPGDPIRAKFIAENFLTDVICYNQVRGMYGFTGLYKGQRLSIQGTGMGMPSMSIYAHELFEEYDVQRMIRIGSCGTIQEHVNTRDVILAMSASTDSQMNKIRFDGMDFAPTADFALLKTAYDHAISSGVKVHVGNVLTSDFFYNDEHLGNPFDVWKSYGVLAVEMETAALYSLAAKFGRQALAILTVSDQILRGEALSPDERQNNFLEMMEIALNTAL
ncbi:purine-nucleoside phosphorylase [Puteibacter caeruleilacunae]|nr:purine-nucleoside phosphorylase [Puteibacter caeruleilacunae]